jgi:predicted esterase
MRRRAIALVILGSLSGRAAAAGDGGSVVVTVTGPGKKVVKEIPVHLGVKAWPGGKFRFTNHDAKSDAKGRATFDGVVPEGTRYGVYAAVAAPGWTLTSRYVWSGTPQPAKPIELTVRSASRVRFRCRNGEGRPIAGVALAPSMRADAEGTRHSVGGTPSDASIATSGADGIAELPYFLAGEWVGVNVRAPGGSWEECTFLLPTESDAVVDVPMDAPKTPDRELAAGGDAKKRVFLTGPKAGDVEPSGGFGVVLVLPGGDGGEGFRDWVRGRYADWVDAGWVWAQLVAPKWSPTQEIVWPTGTSKVDGMKFTTEEFAAAAVEEISKQVKVDRRRVVAVSWSSSGPACWRMLTDKASPITAHLIAMSVFHPDELEPLSNAKARPLFLLHSPTDDRCPIKLAEKGRDAAKKAGLDVEWATYEGGHGWGGDSEDEARRALHWLASKLR